MTRSSAEHGNHIVDRAAVTSSAARPAAPGSVRLLVLSDLHLNFAPFVAPDPALFDIVVLAGDIWTGVKAVAWAAHPDTFGGKPVVYVAGNHEFYGFERIEMLAKIREAAIDSAVHVLDRNEVVISGIRFLGATLWTDFKLDVDKGVDADQAMIDARFGLNDFSGFIRQSVKSPAGSPSFTPYQSFQEHRLSRKWLRTRLTDPVDSKSVISTVVVTHHAPSGKSVHPKFAGSRLNPCFCSELPAEFFQSADLWVHGHVHNSMDYMHHRTRVIANPRGYVRRDGSFENAEFKSDFVVEVPLSNVIGD